MLATAARPALGQHAATNLWKAQIGLYSDSSPALGTNGVIYVATWDGRLIAVNPDGGLRWSLRIGREMKSSPAVAADGTIYVGCRDRRFYAVDAEGRKKWRFQTGAWVDASPALGTDGTVYFGSWDKKFYALTPAGAKKWEFVTGGPVVSSAAIDAKGVIYFGSHDRKLYALNPDGTKRWEFATGGEITSSPAIGGDGVIYITSVDGNLHAINPDGTERWVLRTGGISEASPALGADGTIYLGVNTNYCSITSQGQFITKRTTWQLTATEVVETTPAVSANGIVIFTSFDGAALAMNAKDLWDWKWSFWMDGPAGGSSPAIGPDGTVYVAGYYGFLYAIKNSAPLAPSPWPMFRADPQHTGRVRVPR